MCIVGGVGFYSREFPKLHPKLIYGKALERFCSTTHAGRLIAGRHLHLFDAS